MEKRIIAHLDMDAFFAALEQRENPVLWGKPVVVGADPKGGRGRGVVSTASYEARKFGVHSALPISIAYRKCPHCFFLPPNFSLYEKVSGNIMEICKKYAEKHEQAGLDEIYLDLSDEAKDFGEAESLVKKLAAEIEEKEHITCSAGIGPNKAVAKIASDFKKPRGLTVVFPEKVKEFIAPLPVEKIMGIGPKTKEKLNKVGIRTAGQLARIGEKFLSENFGKWGSELFYLCQGIDENEVSSKRETKSMSREHTFDVDTGDRKIIMDTLEHLAREVCESAKEDDFVFRTVAIKVRYAGFETHTKQITLGKDTGELRAITDWLPDLVEPFLKTGRKIRLLGVRASR